MDQFNCGLNHLRKNSKLIGRDTESEEILYRVASDNMLLIEGEKGIGKTALLKYVIDNFRGKGKVIYVDLNTFSKRLDVGSLLKNRPKGMILLLDNVQNLSRKNHEKIKYFYDQGHIKSVIFTTVNSDLVNFTDAVRTRIGRNIMKLKSICENDAIEVAKKRIYDGYTISEEIFNELYTESTNIKEFLTNCNSLCVYLKKTDREIAGKEDIKKMPRGNTDELRDMETCLECNKKLVKIGEYWRCKNCDMCCGNCGALYNKKDKECPECNTQIVGTKK